MRHSKLCFRSVLAALALVLSSLGFAQVAPMDAVAREAAARAAQARAAQAVQQPQVATPAFNLPAVGIGMPAGQARVVTGASVVPAPTLPVNARAGAPLPSVPATLPGMVGIAGGAVSGQGLGRTAVAPAFGQPAGYGDNVVSAGFAAPPLQPTTPTRQMISRAADVAGTELGNGVARNAVAAFGSDTVATAGQVFGFDQTGQSGVQAQRDSGIAAPENIRYATDALAPARGATGLTGVAAIDANNTSVRYPVDQLAPTGNATRDAANFMAMQDFQNQMAQRDIAYANQKATLDKQVADAKAAIPIRTASNRAAESQARLNSASSTRAAAQASYEHDLSLVNSYNNPNGPIAQAQLRISDAQFCLGNGNTGTLSPGGKCGLTMADRQAELAAAQANLTAQQQAQRQAQANLGSSQSAFQQASYMEQAASNAYSLDVQQANQPGNVVQQVPSSQQFNGLLQAN